MKTDRVNVFLQGLVAGLIGYAVVAVLFAVANVVAGRSPFHTAALLGGALFYGLRDPAAVVVWVGPVLAYNGMHLAIFLVLGAIASWLAELAERGPHFWYIGAVVFIFIAFHMLGLAFALPEAVRSALLGWGLIAAGLVAVAAMAAYLVWMHPRIRSEIRDFSAQDSDLADAE